ncbi:hypothetical protein DP145_06665 [Clostridium tetani]|uniref:hypothetical protein n=1 Tax=Clostridium tetani TaxID=1513 RepID=UPI00100BEC73|nr:hypothetical protein [Clostridium tetani]RXI46256.1 hypothetical protein DP126_04870 [Clostridium tetani]RXM59380.1 hypothetical protein DP138_13885 [Clostridium tetani]RXM67562.1 hypothetical protein DP145_06665 [Clostridium tetani]RXM70868.1 hypothetical protein DP143_13670 [Clostridium tetani]
MYLGKMLIYNKETGNILNGCLKERFDSGLTEEMIKELRPNEVGVLKLPYDYDENNFKEALEYHIDISKYKESTNLKDLIVITKYKEHIETKEEKLRREKQELENQLLMKENETIGGIL